MRELGMSFEYDKMHEQDSQEDYMYRPFKLVHLSNFRATIPFPTATVSRVITTGTL